MSVETLEGDPRFEAYQEMGAQKNSDEPKEEKSERGKASFHLEALDESLIEDPELAQATAESIKDLKERSMKLQDEAAEILKQLGLENEEITEVTTMTFHDTRERRARLDKIEEKIDFSDEKAVALYLEAVMKISRATDYEFSVKSHEADIGCTIRFIEDYANRGESANLLKTKLKYQLIKANLSSKMAVVVESIPGLRA